MYLCVGNTGRLGIEVSEGHVVEQIIRPTGVVDPEIFVRPTQGQVDDLYGEIRLRRDRQERVLVTTLTKRMAEDLTEYLQERGVRVRYLHSEINAIERIEILEALRQGDFDVLVGVNLLREGLDLPEVSLVAILDADKEGFLRAERSAHSNQLAALHDTYGDRRFSMPTPSPKVCKKPSKKRSAAAPFNWPITKPTASPPSPLSRKPVMPSWPFWMCLAASMPSWCPFYLPKLYRN